MLYLYHGDDEFTRAEAVRALRATVLAGEFADLNFVRLDGRALGVSELRHHCDAIPFIGNKRIVLVENLLSRLDPHRSTAPAREDSGEEETIEGQLDPALKQALLTYLPQVPETTHLVLVEDKALAKNNAALRLLESLKEDAQVHRYDSLKPEHLPEWILNRTRSKGGTIQFSAANEMAIYIGDDLRSLDNEIDKLLAYREGAEIRREEVQVMVAPVQEQAIFEMVDALGQHKTDQALRLLHEQLAHNAAPPYIMTMIERQFRLILQARDLQARGLSLDQAGARLGIKSPFVLRKMWEQARGFTPAELEGILHLLLETDVDMKTGRTDPELGLDILVVELTRRHSSTAA